MTQFIIDNWKEILLVLIGATALITVSVKISRKAKIKTDDINRSKVNNVIGNNNHVSNR